MHTPHHTGEGSVPPSPAHAATRAPHSSGPEHNSTTSATNAIVAGMHEDDLLVVGPLSLDNEEKPGGDGGMVTPVEGGPVMPAGVSVGGGEISAAARHGTLPDHPTASQPAAVLPSPPGAGISSNSAQAGAAIAGVISGTSTVVGQEKKDGDGEEGGGAGSGDAVQVAAAGALPPRPPTSAAAAAADGHRGSDGGAKEAPTVDSGTAAAAAERRGSVGGHSGVSSGTGAKTSSVDALFPRGSELSLAGLAAGADTRPASSSDLASAAGAGAAGDGASAGGASVSGAGSIDRGGSDELKGGSPSSSRAYPLDLP
eukprot:scaffold68530_cov16-Tisochrysis_lutea.AAC.1